MRYRMEVPCADCPFSKSEKGTRLRRSLAPGRMTEIRANLRNGGAFECHKTTDETGDGSNLLCAGALEWQHARGISSQMERIGERLAYFATLRKGR